MLTRHKKFVPCPTLQAAAPTESGEKLTKNTSPLNVTASERTIWFDGKVNIQPSSLAVTVTSTRPVTSTRSAGVIGTNASYSACVSELNTFESRSEKKRSAALRSSG